MSRKLEERCNAQRVIREYDTAVSMAQKVISITTKANQTVAEKKYGNFQINLSV